MDLSQLANNISLTDKGYYKTQSEVPVSYPVTGNEECLQVEDSSYWFRHRNNVIAALYAKFCQDKTLVDIGGGNGFVAKNLQELGASVLMVEPGESGVKNAKTRGVKHIIHGGFQDAGFLNNKLDAVGLFDVLEHVEADHELLREINRTLRPDGILIITVPAYGWLWSVDDEAAGHFRRYSLTDIKKDLLNAGFKLEYNSYLFSVLLLPILFFRTLPSKLGIKKNKERTLQKDGAHKPGRLEGVLNWVWKKELRKIKSLKKIGAGSSCVIVARKR